MTFLHHDFLLEAETFFTAHLRADGEEQALRGQRVAVRRGAPVLLLAGQEHVGEALRWQAVCARGGEVL